ncbi:acyl-CoA dehydrogenase family protein [Streptomyces sp. NPDC020799]|uniref:acyl-CoA dehydrogenase family protein n=1 Tax=Streptomyces sp. NPDC020799 TaxID=3365091 RepID=UPI0037AE567D
MDTLLLAALTAGRVNGRWLLDASPRAAKPPCTASEEIGVLLDGHVDPEAVDTERRLPAGLLDSLQVKGYLRLCLEPRLGGLGLSSYDAFKVIEAAARRSVAVALVLGIQNGVGAAALLHLLPPGELRSFVEDRVRRGALSGFALTEPTGQNNAWPATTATPAPDRDGYLLHGEKLFTGNGPVAGLLAVAATTGSGVRRRICVSFVDTSSPGVSVRSHHDFMGGRGLPNAALSFRDVHVPKARVLLGEEGAPGVGSVLGPAAFLGQLLFAAAPAVALVRNCLDWSRSFVARRTIDGRRLGEYPEIRWLIAQTAADLFTIDSVIRWALRDPAPADLSFEILLAKNICVRAADWAVDRTMSLFGAEGLETVASKRRRGAPDVPLERAYRDARMLRTAGNVDFQLDHLAGRLLTRSQAADAGSYGVADAATADTDTPAHGRLDSANQRHLRALGSDARTLRTHCTRLLAACPEAADGSDQERVLIRFGRLSGEVLIRCAVLTAAADNGREDDAPQALADLACSGSRLRTASTWSELRNTRRTRYEELGRRVLDGDV